MLTEQKKRFVDEYLKDLNITQAAIRSGYSPKAAYSTGQRVMKDDEVRALIESKMQKREKRAMVTQDMVIAELVSIGFYDVADFAEVKNNRVRLVDTAKIPKEKRAAIAGIKEGRSGVEVKLADKLKALELLGRHLGLFDGSGADTKPNGIMEAIAEAKNKHGI